MSEFKYVGSELDLFAAVQNWKSYWSDEIRPFIKGDVLEVGAGIGSNTEWLDRGGTQRWVCLEPDPLLTAQLQQKLQEAKTTHKYETICGTLQSLDSQQFDTIIYIDVLEHIENDRGELQKAASLLKTGGHLIVLSPAHQRLFTPFDAAIGHFRRYNRSMLSAISPAGLSMERMRYLDCVGMFASSANVLFLQQSMPTPNQLKLWDSFMIPISRLFDRLIFYSIGKSIIAIWRRPT